MNRIIKNSSYLLIPFLMIAGMAQATELDLPKNSMSDNVLMDKQIQALELLLSKMEEEEDTNHPAHDIYGTWSDSLVNPYKIPLAEVPDSIKFDCSEYVAPIESHVTSRFGQRKARFHYGIDIKLQVGDTLVSAFDGKVRTRGYDKGGYGYYIVVRHHNGLETVYAHLSGYIAEENDFVKAGQPIALGGNTGRSTGSHLHFETRFLGHPIDPERLIDFALFVPKHDSYLMVKASDFEYQTIVAQQRYYTVKSGDSLSRIAQRTGTSVAQLQRLNNLKKNAIIRPGQRLRYS